MERGGGVGYSQKNGWNYSSSRQGYFLPKVYLLFQCSRNGREKKAFRDKRNSSLRRKRRFHVRPDESRWRVL